MIINISSWANSSYLKIKEGMMIYLVLFLSGAKNKLKKKPYLNKL